MTSLPEQLSPQHGLDIKSPRLRLRAVCPADIHPLHAIRTDSIAMKYMTTGVDTEPDAEKSHSLVRMQMMIKPGNFAFAVTTTGAADECETVIGFIGIARPPRSLLHLQQGQLGQRMSQEHKDTLQAYVFDQNAGSSRVLEKAGFKQIGTVLGQIGDRNDMPQRVYEVRRPTG
ncbi:hypothetical protein PG999_005475 [Apiospora kogelbergensis]|uniref:N-acetyltransferase domain-containing protein n=1 Tax=Apiospora kogelbergensis TaxID=1337665 RepID=A0AAW0R2C9_9PEZI